MPEKFYLTTPLYYVNDIPHIGHAYTTIAADVLARYKRLRGDDVFFLTGTDEHGQKIAEAAKEHGRKPQEHADLMVKHFQNAWKELLITNDDFIRTTEKRHLKVVQEVFSQLIKKDDIYKGNYEGWYCTPCETFWTDLQLKEAKLRTPKAKTKDEVHHPHGNFCPDCGRPVEKLKEETYFFRLSKYEKKLLAHIEQYPGFIQPQSRRNEVLSFVGNGLKDLSVTRTAFKWGVPLPQDPKHVVYVWFDALINYITAPGLFTDEKRFKSLWPADVHIMGKEIVRFHAVIWPCMLMALGIPLPKKVFGHGWWTVEGEKMSKSKGNVVDPLALKKEFGLDTTRYFLLRAVPFGHDGDFSRKELIQRYNADLANDLGNLLNRSLTMVEKYFGGEVPKSAGHKHKLDEELIALAKEVPEKVNAAMDNLAFSDALASIWQLINKANTYIEKSAPWKLAKEKKDKALAAVMYNLVEVLRLTTILVLPFMPLAAEKMWQQLGIIKPLNEQTSKDLEWGKTEAGIKVKKGKPLFPRIETN